MVIAGIPFTMPAIWIGLIVIFLIIEGLTAGLVTIWFAVGALAALIEGEDPAKPLSDAKLAKLLAEQGCPVSRRTVVKYREQLGIASSVKRKRY